MEVRLKEKQVRDNFIGIIPIGYCDLYYTLKAKGRCGWTCGVYGWNSDIYDLGNGYAISSGYRPIGNIKKPNGIIAKYEKKEKAIENDKRYKNWESRQKALVKLLDKFVKEVLEYNKLQ